MPSFFDDDDDDDHADADHAAADDDDSGDGDDAVGIAGTGGIAAVTAVHDGDCGNSARSGPTRHCSASRRFQLLGHRDRQKAGRCREEQFPEEVRARCDCHV